MRERRLELPRRRSGSRAASASARGQPLAVQDAARFLRALRRLGAGGTTAARRGGRASFTTVAFAFAPLSAEYDPLRSSGHPDPRVQVRAERMQALQRLSMRRRTKRRKQERAGSGPAAPSAL